MPVTAATLRKLSTLNLDANQMAGVLELLAEQQEAEEVRLAAQRERKARQRAGQSRDSHGTKSGQERDTSFPPEVPPAPPPNPSITNPPSPPKGGSSPTEFSAFWDLYPNKTGKAAAQPKFAKARQKASFETIMAGLRAYAAKTDDRPWCNPATWLHQERWADEPAHQPRGSPQFYRPERPDPFKDLSKELIDEHERESRGNGHDWNDAQGIPFVAIEHHGG